MICTSIQLVICASETNMWHCQDFLVAHLLRCTCRRKGWKGAQENFHFIDHYTLDNGPPLCSFIDHPSVGTGGSAQPPGC